MKPRLPTSTSRVLLLSRKRRCAKYGDAMSTGSFRDLGEPNAAIGKQIKELEGERKELQAIVVGELGDCETGCWEGKPVVTYKNTGAVNENGLYDQFPELAEQYSYKMNVTKLNTTELYKDHGDTIAPLRSRRFLPKAKV